MRAAMTPQIDAFASDARERNGRGDEIGAFADGRNDAAMMNRIARAMNDACARVR